MLVHEHLRSVVKENLRSARFLARELKSSVRSVERGNPWLPQPAVALTSAVAEFSDSALSRLEEAALGLVSADPELRSGQTAPRPLSSYFPSRDPHPDPNREILFARDQYAAAKRILTEKGAANPSISEMTLAQAYRRVAASSAAGETDPCRLAAAVTLAIATSRPVASPAHLVEGESGTVRNANLFVSAVLGLSLAVASLSEEDASASEVNAAAGTAVDIGWLEVEAAFRREPEQALARLFAEWAPHLP